VALGEGPLVFGVPAVVEGDPDGEVQVEAVPQSLLDSVGVDVGVVGVRDGSGGFREGALGRDCLAGGGVGEAVLPRGEPVDDVGLGVDQRVMAFTLCRPGDYADGGFHGAGGGGGRAGGDGIIRGFRGRPGAGRAGGSGRGWCRAGWCVRVLFP
jgi:hypothetical protein